MEIRKELLVDSINNCRTMDEQIQDAIETELYKLEQKYGIYIDYSWDYKSDGLPKSIE